MVIVPFYYSHSNADLWDAYNPSSYITLTQPQLRNIFERSQKIFKTERAAINPFHYPCHVPTQATLTRAGTDVAIWTIYDFSKGARSDWFELSLCQTLAGLLCSLGYEDCNFGPKKLFYLFLSKMFWYLSADRYKENTMMVMIMVRIFKTRSNPMNVKIIIGTVSRTPLSVIIIATSSSSSKLSPPCLRLLSRWMMIL